MTMASSHRVANTSNGPELNRKDDLDFVEMHDSLERKIDELEASREITERADMD